MESRVKEIDYLKCIFITLMIIFHLVYIGDKYPYAKQIVYTFHMSAFLIISGYLANNRKDARSFLRKLLWIFIPYACMEAAYTVMSHFLPVQAKRLSFFIGRNTLVILLFSPIFTILSKAFLPVFAFDPTGMLFLVTATAFTLSGCMGMAWAMDKIHVSRFFFGKRTILC